MHRKPIRILGVVLLSSLAMLLLFTPNAPSKPYYANINRPLVIAHQGVDGLCPGDTLYAFEQAIEIGAGMPSLFSLLSS